MTPDNSNNSSYHAADNEKDGVTDTDKYSKILVFDDCIISHLTAVLHCIHSCIADDNAKDGVTDINIQRFWFSLNAPSRI